MDLSAIIKDTKLKIRVAGLVETPVGFLFEKSDKDYIFPIGGKVMVNETSREALIREIKEEIGMQVDDVNLVSVLENLYGSGNGKVHEICFVYKVGTLFEGVVPEGFLEVPRNEIDKFEIMPKPIADILKSNSEQFKHIIIR